MKRVAILISGGGSNMVKLCQSMHGDHSGRPALVMSNDPTAGGLEKARDMGISTAAVDHRPFGKDRAAFEAVLVEKLREAEIDIVCLAGFMRILTKGFVGHFEGKMLNIHPSLLPKYPGLNTHTRAIDAGDAISGCTVHQVTAVLDDGPILGQATVPILDGDTPDTLSARVLVQEHRLYPAVLKRFCVGESAILKLA